MARILLIDDDRNLREVVNFILTEAGHEVLTAGDGDEGLARFETEDPDLVLTDIRMPGRDGMDVLRHLCGPEATPPVSPAEKARGGAAAAALSPALRAPTVPVIVLTAYGTVEQAVEAMKVGAFTYLLKPFNRDELRLTVKQALRAGALVAENRRLRHLLRQKSEHLPLVYTSATMQRLVDQVRQIAPSEATVLIGGQSGTGKELIARAVHDLSPRWDKPFVAVNCGALPADLVESELFGHARGAFTGAAAAAPGRIRAAAGGTLFLDEVGELPLPLQPKLLRVLETKLVDPVGQARPVPVDFRLVCASNRDLVADVRQGRFRQDLFYRLEVVHLQVPPLRDRPGDISLLWEHFTRVHGGEMVRSEAELLRRLERRPWPGNVRELMNLNQRLVLMRKSDVLTVADLEAETPGVAPSGLEADSSRPEGEGPSGLPLASLPEDGFSLPELEKEIIRQALHKCGGNKTRTAKYLGIPRHVLVYRLGKYGL